MTSTRLALPPRSDSMMILSFVGLSFIRPLVSCLFAASTISSAVAAAGAAKSPSTKVMVWTVPSFTFRVRVLPPLISWGSAFTDSPPLARVPLKVAGMGPSPSTSMSRVSPSWRSQGPATVLVEVACPPAESRPAWTSLSRRSGVSAVEAAST